MLVQPARPPPILLLVLLELFLIRLCLGFAFPTRRLCNSLTNRLILLAFHPAQPSISGLMLILTWLIRISFETIIPILNGRCILLLGPPLGRLSVIPTTLLPTTLTLSRSSPTSSFSMLILKVSFIRRQFRVVITLLIEATCFSR